MNLYDKAEVITYLREAHEAVDEAGVPDDLREVAFTSAVNALSQKQVRQAVPLDPRLLGR